MQYITANLISILVQELAMLPVSLTAGTTALPHQEYMYSCCTHNTIVRFGGLSQPDCWYNQWLYSLGVVLLMH